jgi:hypothetical protein
MVRMICQRCWFLHLTAAKVHDAVGVGAEDVEDSTVEVDGEALVGIEVRTDDVGKVDAVNSLDSEVCDDADVAGGIEDDREGEIPDTAVDKVVGMLAVEIALESVGVELGALVVLEAIFENRVPNSERVKPAGTVRSVGQNSRGIVVPLITVAPAARALSR